MQTQPAFMVGKQKGIAGQCKSETARTMLTASLRASAGRLKVPLEATLAVCVGFNLVLAILIVIYIVSLRVNPDDFRWLQPKAKARQRPCLAALCVH